MFLFPLFYKVYAFVLSSFFVALERSTATKHAKVEIQPETLVFFLSS